MTPRTTEPDLLPAMPFDSWKDTLATLHMWTQVVGKVRLKLCPLVNHYWNVTFYVTARGMTTSAMPFQNGTVPGNIEVRFDFIDHQLALETSAGRHVAIALKAQSVADFYNVFMNALAELGVDAKIWTTPCEVPDPIPFEKDRVHAAYDPDAVHKFWRILVWVDQVFKEFRAGFIGKVSPVHFFWGSFDLAVTRFSGRTAPPPKGVTPHVASWVMAEAYSHEVSSCGFWPGNGGFGYPAFYVYAYPEPAGYSGVRLRTAEASYNKDLGQFILPYDAVRKASDPDALLLEFLQETYAAAADLENWDRRALERS